MQPFATYALQLPDRGPWMNEARRLGRNFAAVTLAQIISQVLAFVVSISVARTLGVEQYGLFVFGFAFPSWFLWLVSFELDSVLAIEVAADRSQAGLYLTAISLLRIPLVILAIALLLVSVQLVLFDPLARAVTLILGAASILGTYASVFRSMFTALERLEFGALVLATERFITTAAVLFLLVSGFGLLQISVVYVFTTVISAALALAILRLRFVWFTRGVSPALLADIFRRALPFALEAVVTTFLYTAGPILATVLASSEATGSFNAAFSIVLALLTPLTLYHAVVLPTMSRLYHETRDSVRSLIQRGQKLAFVVGLPIAVGGWIYAPRIMEIMFGSAFLASAESFRVLVLVAASASATIGMGAALSAAGKQRLNLGIGTLGTGANLILCIVLIPYLGAVGAACAFLAADVLMVVPTWIAIRRIFGSLHFSRVVLRPALSVGTMVVVLSVLPDLPLWIMILIGAGIYLGSLVIIGGLSHEDWALLREVLKGVLAR